MSLLLRAQVARAAHDIVPSWPLHSFIAVNPLAGSESRPFGSIDEPGVAVTRSAEEYLKDLHRGRIPVEALERAIVHRVPALRQSVEVAGSVMRASAIAALDMIEHPFPAPCASAEPASPVDRYVSGWLGAYVDPEPLWPMPHREQGLYRAWHRLAPTDPALPRATRRRVAAAPSEAGAALELALRDVPERALLPTLRRELSALPGWVAHLKWRADRVGDVDLTGYLALRMTLAAALGHPVVPAPPEPEEAPAHPSRESVWERAARLADSLTEHTASPADVAVVARVIAEHPQPEHPLTWQAALEGAYRSDLLERLSASAESAERPTAQVVLCIDPRSEGMRRHLERYRGVDTIGFAGFFGVPIRFARLAARGSVDAMPALLTPRHAVAERALDERESGRAIAASRRRGALRDALHAADSTALSPFAFAEAAGWFGGAATAVRTLTPRLYSRVGAVFSSRARRLATRPSVEDSFTLEERAALAATALRTMGMPPLAPLVLLTGHGSHSLNNLYQSALDCGACGGNPGGANARAAAAILNDPRVRAVLAADGIDIPRDTVFVAAEHDTVRDAVTVLDAESVPESHRSRLAELEELLAEAGARLAAERSAHLPGTRTRTSADRARRRAADWAEVYPELGLAGNAAMIIGPRAMTRGVDLERRVFLHTYHAETDPDGVALETIMTAPLIVAQWINHQYYFSALNPQSLGAGTKTIHNAIGSIGVLAGHGGDLRRGLPWQSVGFGRDLLHEPLRLTVAIEAPLDRIGRIVSGNQMLRNLLDNGWISLTARADRRAPWYRYTSYGWTPDDPEPARPSIPHRHPQNEETPA